MRGRILERSVFAALTITTNINVNGNMSDAETKIIRSYKKFVSFIFKVDDEIKPLLP